MISKAQIKYIQSLHLKKNRIEEGLFIVEGVKIVNELLVSELYQIHSVYHTESFEQQKTKKEFISYSITEKELAQISTLTNPNQVLALVYLNKPFNYKLNDSEIYLALDDIKDPGNMGTIIRTAEWFGIQTIFCSENCVEYTNPKVIMASMGSFLRMNIVYENLENLFINHSNIPILGASLQGANLYESKLPKNGILIIGSESHGISKELDSYINYHIKIPAFGKAESLNASIANAIILSDWKKQHYGGN